MLSAATFAWAARLGYSGPDGGRSQRGRLGFVWKRSRVLVLTRKTNQSIMIGDDVEISVLAVTGDKVRIGITAPREVPVFRKEVYLSIQAEKLAAAAGNSGDVQKELRKLQGD
jgi:carbon storage regulator